MNGLNVSRTIMAAVILLALAACGPRLNKANYDKVAEGMSSAQVKAILGEPSEMKSASVPLVGSVTTYSYKVDKSEAEFVFYDDKLKSKSGTIVE